METITKIALYARVSLDAEAEEIRYQDPENQLAPMREACKVRGWEITGEYIDRASGGDSNRPQFIQLRADAHRYKFNKVFVWNLDRFSREGIQRTLAYIQDLRKYGIGVVSYTE
jgi:DNA invertase Pin-like site-specific DNA recombinase